MKVVSRDFNAKALTFVGMFCTVCTEAMAQSADVDTMVSDVTDTTRRLGKLVLDLLSYILLIVGGILVVTQSIKFARDDPQKSDVYMKLGIGLIAGFGLLKLIKTWM